MILTNVQNECHAADISSHSRIRKSKETAITKTIINGEYDVTPTKQNQKSLRYDYAFDNAAN